MSNREAIDAYVDGRISRRTLVRRLVTGGVSFGAAAAYAQVLDPARALAENKGGWGPSAAHIDARSKIVEEPLGRVVQKGRVRIKVQSHRSIDSLGEMTVRLLRPNQPDGWTDSVIGVRSFSFKGHGTKTYDVKIDFSSHSLDALRAEKHRAHLTVEVTGLSGKKFVGMGDEAILKR